MTENNEHVSQELDMELLTKSLETILPDLLKNYKKQIASKKIMLDKIKEEERKKRDLLKGTVICKAKKCNKYLYKNQSTSNPEYCMECL